jgi:hypothetical protein
MSENMGTALGPAQTQGDSPEELDNPPLWSPWNFQTKKRDWHEVVYDEMRSSSAKTQNT